MNTDKIGSTRIADIADTLYCGGWRKDDREQMIGEYDLTEEEADAICELLEEMEEAEEKEAMEEMEDTGYIAADRKVEFAFVKRFRPIISSEKAGKLCSGISRLNGCFMAALLIRMNEDELPWRWVPEGLAGEISVLPFEAFTQSEHPSFVYASILTAACETGLKALAKRGYVKAEPQVWPETDGEIGYSITCRGRRLAGRILDAVWPPDKPLPENAALASEIEHWRSNARMG